MVSFRSKLGKVSVRTNNFSEFLDRFFLVLLSFFDFGIPEWLGLVHVGYLVSTCPKFLRVTISPRSKLEPSIIFQGFELLIKLQGVLGGSSHTPFISHRNGHLEGTHNPILKGLTITMVDNHWDDPPSVSLSLIPITKGKAHRKLISTVTLKNSHDFLFQWRVSKEGIPLRIPIPFHFRGS